MPDLRIVDYASLRAAVQDELNRADLVDQIPLFIQRFEASFIREVRWHKLTARDTDAAPAERVPLPVDFIELKTIALGEKREHSVRPVALLELLNVKRTAQPVGVPLIYAIDGGDLVFPWAPGVPLEITSYIRLPVLGQQNQTNVLLEEHPDAYLYGALAQAEMYLKNDERVTLWAALMRDVLAAIQEESRRAERAPDTYVARPRRVL
jgi:hypothetical protein